MNAQQIITTNDECHICYFYKIFNLHLRLCTLLPNLTRCEQQLEGLLVSRATVSWWWNGEHSQYRFASHDTSAVDIKHQAKLN